MEHEKDELMRNDLIFTAAFTILTAWAYFQGWTALALFGSFLLGVSFTVLAVRMGWTRSLAS